MPPCTQSDDRLLARLPEINRHDFPTPGTKSSSAGRQPRCHRYAPTAPATWVASRGKRHPVSRQRTRPSNPRVSNLGVEQAAETLLDQRLRHIAVLAHDDALGTLPDTPHL